MTRLLLITRPPEASAPLVARLRRAGIDARSTPCVLRVPLPLDPHQLDPWRGRPARVALTSPAAVPAARALRLDPAWEVRVLAPGTLAAATAAGLSVHRAVEGGAADLVRNTGDRPLLLLGSDLAGDEARRANPALVHVVVYRTSRPGRLDLPPGPFDAFFASPSAVAGFLALAGPAAARLDHCLCFGRTTARAAAAAGLDPIPCSVEDLFHATPSAPPAL